MTVILPKAGSYLLANARVPVDLMTVPAPVGPDRIADVDLRIDAGRIMAIGPRGALAAADVARADLRDGLVLPRFVDSHTHLDKGHIWARSPNPDGTFLGARATVMADREARWHADDVRRRMDFALRCAYAHGTAAIRTHIDSVGKQTGISWPVFAEMRAAWKGRIALQAAALFPIEFAIDDADQFAATVATVAKYGGVLGGLTFLGEPLTEKLDRALDRAFAAAAAHGLDVDFHVDESDLPHARSLERIADAALRARFKGRIVAGHCCSLTLYDEAEHRRVVDKLGAARIAVVSLPMCNMYLQDRKAGRTPRWRGVAPLHELDAAGIPVMVASDNTRDPFYAYGDLDMLEVHRAATRILQLDHSDRPWPRLLGPASAEVMGLDGGGRLSAGAPADFVVTGARTWNELNARPQADRVVVVGGKAIDRTLPDYRELDQVEAG